MAIDTSKFAVQQIFVVDAFDLETGEMITRFEDLKTSTLSNNGTVVYTQGGVGNPKIIGFSHSKESTLDIESAVITEGGLAVQTGNDVVALTNSTAIPFDDVVTVSTADTALTTYTATGSEIGFIYILNDDGTKKTTLTQVATTPTVTEFTYATATKTITTGTGALSVGDKVLIIYYPTAATAVKVSNSTNVFAKNVRLHCRTLFRDTCTGQDYIGVLVIYKAKAGEEWSLELSADGDPVVHSISFEALKSCSSNVLWDIFIYDSTDLS